MDDMVEYLGPEILGAQYATVATQIIKFCNAPNPAMRQASTYGIGVMAKNGGAYFGTIVNDCLQGLRLAIDFEMPSSIKEKKAKVKQFNHARDNAVSALGKVIRYQPTTVDLNTLIPGWLNLLPLKNDVEESKIQNEILATILTENPILIVGDQYQRLEQLVIILGTVLQKKYVEDETGLKLARFIKNALSDANVGPHVTTYASKLPKEA
jgi:importin-5